MCPVSRTFMPEEDQKLMPDKYYYWLGLRIAADFGATIAVPAVLAALLGKYLDQKWGTEPWLMIMLLLIAAAVTAVIIKRKAKYYAKLYDRRR